MGENAIGYSPYSSEQTEKTYEDYKRERAERNKKAAEEVAKKTAEALFVKERALEVHNTQDLLAYNADAIKELEKAKSKNKTAIVNARALLPAETDEKGRVKKTEKKKGAGIKGWLNSAWTAVKGVGKSIIGIDENGKWHPGQCAKNIAIIAGAVGLCCIPYVGPVIAAGLAVAGVGMGAYGVIKGIGDLKKADNPEAEEAARQTICSNAFIGILSAVGVRGIGSSASTAAKVAGVTNTASKAVSTVAKVRTGIGKPIQWTSQLGRDMTVNVVRGTKQAMDADKALIASKGSGFNGFMKAYVTKLGSNINLSSSIKAKYDAKYQRVENALTTRETQLTELINTETNASKQALLREELKMVQSNLKELHSLGRKVKSKTDYEKLRTENSASQNLERMENYHEYSTGEFRIRNQRVSAEDTKAFRQQMEVSQNAYESELKSLINTKDRCMSAYARRPKKHKKELDEYTLKTYRKKYNTPKKLEAQKKSLNKKIEDCDTKIADIEEKIARRTENGQPVDQLQARLKTLNTTKKAAEEELELCERIKFGHWYNPSSCNKNEYQLFIGNDSRVGMASKAGQALTSPIGISVMTAANFDRQMEVPLFSDELAEITPEQIQEYLQQLRQERQSLEQALGALNNVKDYNEWNTLKAQLEEIQKQAQNTEGNENNGLKATA